MKNKRGQGMSTQTIILLILGLVILAVLIFGFTSGWSSFKKQIYKTNVDSVKEDCSSVCSAQAQFSYCSALREYRINEQDLDIQTSCAVLATEPSFGGYVESCGAVTCDLACNQIVIADKNGNQKKGKLGANVPAGAYDVSALANDVQKGQFCYIQ